MRSDTQDDYRERLLRVMVFIQNHLDEPLPLDDLAVENNRTRRVIRSPLKITARARNVRHGRMVFVGRSSRRTSYSFSINNMVDIAYASGPSFERR